MKRFDLVLSILLIVIGLVCLTMSGTLMLDAGVTVYVKTFVQICLWMGVPLVLAGLFYWQYKRKRR